MAKKIRLTNGMVAVVDAKNYLWLRRFKWRAFKGHTTYYAVRGRATFMHREICGLQPGDGKEVDHQNFNGLDNREANLVVCSRRQNLSHRRHASKYGVGVTKDSRRQGRFQARVTIHGCRKHIGMFATAQAARAARANYIKAHNLE